MDSPNTIEIHEFSTGIIPEKTADGGWVSRGFTGQYINATIEPIPHAVERAILNKEFAVAEGASSEQPAIIGRVVSSEDSEWSVIAIVTRGQDEIGRSASLYRYLLTQEKDGLMKILAWLENEKEKGKSIKYNPFNYKKIGYPNEINEIQNSLASLNINEFDLSNQILSRKDNISYSPSDINELAKQESKKNLQSIAWAFNVEALEKPQNFQVIYPAEHAELHIYRFLSNVPSISASVIDEQAIKSAIKGLINSSQVKPEYIQTLAESLESVKTALEIPKNTDFWDNIFNGQGAANALNQKIYSPQMIRLITLRAIILPEKILEYLNWIGIGEDKKNYEYSNTSLAFQKQISNTLSQYHTLKTHLIESVKYIIENVSQKRISVQAASWILGEADCIWKKVMPSLVAVLSEDLSLIGKNKKYSKVKNLEFLNKFKIDFIDPIYSHKTIKQEPLFLANLFANLDETAIAACFYQAAQGKVPANIYSSAKKSKEFRNGCIFGLKVNCGKTPLDHFSDFAKHPVAILFLAVFTMSIAGYLSFNYFKILDFNKILNLDYSKNFNQKSDIKSTSKDDLFSETEIPSSKLILEANKHFDETRKVIKSLVQELEDSQENLENNKERSIGYSRQALHEKIIKILESELLNKDISEKEFSMLDYESNIENNDSRDFMPNNNLKGRWISLIYSYQVRDHNPNPVGYLKTGGQTYESLKKKIQIKLDYTPLDQGQTQSLDNSKNQAPAQGAGEIDGENKP